MIFNSYIFCIIFLPITLFLFLITNKINQNFKILLFITLSFIFYGFYSPALVLLLLLSICTNYLFSLFIAKHSNSYVLYIIILINLVILFYFKYSLFFIEELFLFENKYNLLWEYSLPIGISFFTFQQISYQVDLFKKNTKNEGFLKYLFFVSFFPQLVAGPIVKHKFFIKQITNNKFLKIDDENFKIGITVFSIGIIKKVLLADSISYYIDQTYNDCFKLQCSQSDYIISTYLYSAQIYFDFSAYSDMAIGLAKIFGIKLPFNFNSPYKSKSLIDFWRSWHVTLSSFLKNYLYIPMGGGRVSDLRKYSNLLFTMFLGGLWHGAGLNFILWGIIHGVGLIVNHYFKFIFRININKYISLLITFTFVSIAWIFFRSENIYDAISIFFSLFTFNDFEPKIYRLDNSERWLTICIISVLVIFFFPNSNRFYEKYISKFRIIKYLFVIMLIICIFTLDKSSEFIYYEF
ncbi:MBOAT family protein [Alphaproteobacteria bacterium]|jgi:alginate O-acetyltransferase complex protein AlgI|nr:MBOAT family protein [Alphaproteobacteria bacterium]